MNDPYRTFMEVMMDAENARVDAHIASSKRKQKLFGIAVAITIIAYVILFAVCS
jgi:hypothetical protein